MIFKTKGDNGIYKRQSRWIEIKYRSVTERHSLYNFSDDGILCYFLRKGKEYALGQFMRFNPPLEISNGKEIVKISGYDCTSYFYPYLIEINETGEAVRLYTRESEDE